MPLLSAAFRRGFVGNVRFALGAILQHKLRSSLTILGIVVGVTTVMAMVAIVTGFNENVVGNLQTFGANRIEIDKYEARFGDAPERDEVRRRRNLTVDDAAALRQLIPEATVSLLVGYDDAYLHVRAGNLEANGPYVIGRRRLPHRDRPHHQPGTVLHSRRGAAQRARHPARGRGAGGALPQRGPDREGRDR